MSESTTGYLLISLVMGLFVTGTTCLIIDCIINKSNNNLSYSKNEIREVSYIQHTNNDLDFDLEISGEYVSDIL